MLELLIVRHGHSPIASDDHARILSPEGQRDAKAVGTTLANLGWVPQHVICSTAERTRMTATELCAAFVGAPSIQHSRRLYAPGGSDQPEDSLYECGDQLIRVMIIGHNPTLEEAVERIAGLTLTLRPASWVHIRFDTSHWTQLAQAHGRVLHVGHAGKIVLK